MSDSIELPRSYTDAFAQEQARVKDSSKFWDRLTDILDAVVAELNKYVEHGKLGTESPTKHTLEITYLGRRLKLAMDHCEQRFFYALYGASSHLDSTEEPVESGSLSLNRDEDDDGVTLEGDTDLQIRSSSRTSSRRSVQQQLAEQLLGKLTMPKWTDDRFDDTP